MKITIHSRNERHEFEGDEDQSLLMAGLSRGYALPYACASGTCGSCSARLTAGKVEDLWSAAPGKKSTAKADEVLLCQCAPRGDCEIELKQSVAQVAPDEVLPFTVEGTVTRWELLTHDVASWEIELQEPMNYQAGQFVLLGTPGISGYRAYSIVNYERDSCRLELLIKRKPGGGLSEAYFGASQVGTAVRVMGPLGQAVFKPSQQKNLLCIAGGSGVAGMMSILSHAQELDYFWERRGAVYFGVRSMRDTFFLERLAGFSRAARGGLEITICISDEPVSPDAAQQYPGLAFAQGFVHEVALRQMAGRLSEVHAFLAGPPPAVDAAMRGLVLQGKLSPTNISYDKFN